MTDFTIHTYDQTAAQFAQRTYSARRETEVLRFLDYLRGEGIPRPGYLSDDLYRQRSAARSVVGKRVLDVGCGPGRDAAHLQEHGLQVVGIDASTGMIEEARKRVPPPAEFIQMDMRKLDFPDDSFDGVWCNASLLHIPRDEVQQVLSEIHRVLHYGPLFLAVKEGEGDAIVGEAEGEPRFFTYFTIHEIQLLVEHAGFDVHEVHFGDTDPYGKRWINLFARKRLLTPKCGANAVIFNDEGHVLLTQREDNGYWCLPGGHMDFGESVEQTAIRETREETGLDVAIDKLVGIYSYSAPPGVVMTTKPKLQFLLICYLCHVIGGSITKSEETLEVAFFPLDGLPDEIVPSHIKRIHDAVRVREGGEPILS